MLAHPVAKAGEILALFRGHMQQDRHVLCHGLRDHAAKAAADGLLPAELGQDQQFRPR